MRLVDADVRISLFNNRPEPLPGILLICIYKFRGSDISVVFLVRHYQLVRITFVVAMNVVAYDSGWEFPVFRFAV